MAGEEIQLGWRRDRKRAQQHGVDQRENRRVGADAEGQRHDDHRGEAGIPAKLPHGVPEVAPRRFDWRDAAGIAALLFDLFQAADRRTGAPPCVIFRGTAGDEPGGLAVEMLLELLDQVPLHRPAPEDCPQPVPDMLNISPLP